MQKSHHLLGCHAIGVNSSLIPFFGFHVILIRKSFFLLLKVNSFIIICKILQSFDFEYFFKFNLPSQKSESDQNNSIRIAFMKIIIKINPKKAVGHGVAGGVEYRFDPTPPPFWFSKNESSKYRVKPWFFVTFNIIISHIFLENFIEIPVFVQKI